VLRVPGDQISEAMSRAPCGITPSSK
jgi:hypothetical protein